jgi:hypothetical protein
VRIRSAFLVVLSALLMCMAVPAGASAAGYKVWKASGSAAGRVVPGPVPDQGSRIGVIRDLSKFRGAVYSKQTSSGHRGWPVSNGSSYVSWVKQVSRTRFAVTKVPGGSAAGRVTRISNGNWLAQKRSSGRWVTVGRVQKGCRGHWAAGALRLLLW